MGIGRDFGYFVYHSDDGNDYSVKIAKAYGTPAALGFGAYDNTKPLLPAGMRMRGVNVMDPTTKSKRRVPIGSVTCDVWTLTEDQVTVPAEGDSDGVVMDVQSRYPEKPARVPHVIVNY